MKKFILFATMLLSLHSSAQTLPVVQTDAGKVSGTFAGKVRSFKGIPFASPPVGELRWKAPVAIKPWRGIRECQSFGPSPMQPKPAPFGPWTWPYLIEPEPISEDCLYLNVWTPAEKAGRKLPVLVWVYGGGFTSGGSSCKIYDGEALAAKGVVVVSFNYRVGIFGFFSHPELSNESGIGASGNYGLMDQIAALQWVKRNIASFGGDPANVTIAGQSAGSMSVNALVASPVAAGLFQKAIAQSGANFTRTSPTLEEAEQEGMRLAGGASLSRLRSLPPEEIMSKDVNMRGPVVDGYVLPKQIADIFQSGSSNTVALLTGWNLDEGLMFGPPKKAVEFRREIGELFGSDSASALTCYRASNDEQAARSQLELSRDRTFAMQNFIWAKTEADKGNKVYVYRFARKVPAAGELERYGAYHTGEVPYVFDNLRFGDRPYDSSDRKLASMMSAYWVNFIKTGNPNASGLPQWPIFDAKVNSMLFDAKSRPERTGDADCFELLYRRMLNN